MVGLEMVYASGVIWAVVLIGFVFLFVSYTDGSWFVGPGLAVAVVSGLVIVSGWHALADYPLEYRDGDRPQHSTSGLTLYETWDLDSGKAVSTSFTVDDAADAESLSGTLWIEYGCPQASVDWRINLDGKLLASGTLREGDERELEDLAVRLGDQPVVQLTAARTDQGDCKTALLWENPGFEGPGHGKFRFVFPLPDAD
ncbi:hypothetical protein [Kribbella sp. NPDC006257]|uniref:hypothetical protein n=1 Tax=Kribbella sp. NPDC006257 TaxID=3156738 RepID=UPI0033A5E43B